MVAVPCHLKSFHFQAAEKTHPPFLKVTSAAKQAARSRRHPPRLTSQPILRSKAPEPLREIAQGLGAVRTEPHALPSWPSLCRLLLCDWCPQADVWIPDSAMLAQHLLPLGRSFTAKQLPETTWGQRPPDTTKKDAECASPSHPNPKINKWEDCKCEELVQSGGKQLMPK